MPISQYLRGNSQMEGEKENWDDESDESEPEDFADCEDRPEHTFENGAVYKGKWKGDVRHG